MSPSQFDSPWQAQDLLVCADPTARPGPLPRPGSLRWMQTSGPASSSSYLSAQTRRGGRDHAPDTAQPAARERGAGRAAGSNKSTALWRRLVLLAFDFSTTGETWNVENFIGMENPWDHDDDGENANTTHSTSR